MQKTKEATLFMLLREVQKSKFTRRQIMSHRIYTQPFSSVYPLYIAKAEKKSRTQSEVNKIIMRLTGYDQKQLKNALHTKITFEEFRAQAPKLNPKRKLIKGTVCGVKVQDVKEELMREIRYLDMMIQRLANGKKMEKILLS